MSGDALRAIVTRAANNGKKLKAHRGQKDPQRCSVPGCGRTAIFVWRGRGFCRKDKEKAYAFTAATPMLLPKEILE